MFGMGFAEIADGIWSDDLGLARAAIITKELTISPAAINGVGITGIRCDVTALTSSGGMPVTEGDSSVIAAAENENAAAILLRAVNVIREVVVNRNVIELRGRLVIPAAPGAAGVHAYACALIAAKNHTLWIAGINPESVIVVASGRALDRDKSLSSIGGAIDGDIGDVDGVGIFRVDIKFAEIPQPAANARISPGAKPSLSAVI